MGFDDDTGDYAKLDPESLRDVYLEAKIDGETPLEVCLKSFNLAALEEPDCIDHGMFELHESVKVLLEAGAIITPTAKTLLEDLRSFSNIIKGIKRHDPHSYEAGWGAEEEADAVLACAKQMEVRTNESKVERPKSSPGDKRKMNHVAAGASSSEANCSTSPKA